MRCKLVLIAFTSVVLAGLPSYAAPFTSEDFRTSEDLMRRASVVTTDPSIATSRTFDYIIVGGGLAGLVVANRLSEKANINVLVIEAGADTRNDDRIASLDAYGSIFLSSSKDINWQFTTTNGKTISAGRGLGGSTSINGGAITRADTAQLDNIGKLGNQNWDSNSLSQYMKKAETFVTPNTAQVNAGARFTAEAHGTNGPLTIRFGEVQSSSRRDLLSNSSSAQLQKRFYTGPYQSSFVQSVKTALGVDRINDLSDGHTNGVAYTPNSMLPGSGNLRSSSATAYLTPIEQKRSNLVVLTTWRGWKTTWSSTARTPTATGVIIQQNNGGPTYNVKASREIIVAAGAIRSPVFLEHSGIGDANILRNINVPVKVDLPGVGKNLQEQTMSVFGASRKNGVSFGGVGPSNLIAQPAAGQLFSNATAVRSYIESNYQNWAQAAVSAGGAVSTDGLIAQWRLQTEALFTDNVGAVEMFVDSGYPNNGFGVEMWPLLPYSRGSVHTSSASTFAKTIVDPRYFSVPFDMDMQVAGCRGVRRVYQTSPVSDLFAAGEEIPGFDVSRGGIPDGPKHGAFARWQKWISEGYSSVAHPVGTCALLPRQMGGVVDANFKVYGTANVRVVDASTLPQLISAHLSSTLYGIAERAADQISASQ
ncbi:unnamed protein product [Tilletia controversa]|uniref:Glucose oxidase n=1 Tax=Tilletia controversa TaxID=13291 RepID=A0A8X7SUT8_9BASI|nr:hypothetical protein CF328_g6770 [Tilletia controversa]KAE8242666.1 hypothetical protein A4X06_0g6806 [Tilletia controversa]CAD6901169.1 unnamed protein product [Tilletia controversa]CAD6961568.1 unnamed protein product [Tilletia controversa]CAD6973577.1 unnamed protein product [Tilletia controversa]